MYWRKRLSRVRGTCRSTVIWIAPLFQAARPVLLSVYGGKTMKPVFPVNEIRDQPVCSPKYAAAAALAEGANGAMPIQDEPEDPHYMKRAKHVRVRFSREGWKQFAAVNAGLGSAFLRAFQVRRELALYIAAHEEKNTRPDGECAELCYEDGIFLIIRHVNGAWCITDVYTTGASVAFEPVLVWTRIKRGCGYTLTQALACWRRMTAKATTENKGEPAHEAV